MADPIIVYFTQHEGNRKYAFVAEVCSTLISAKHVSLDRIAELVEERRNCTKVDLPYRIVCIGPENVVSMPKHVRAEFYNEKIKSPEDKAKQNLASKLINLKPDQKK